MQENKSLRDTVTKYVYATLPVRMIRLNDMGLVDRSAVIREIMDIVDVDTNVKAALQVEDTEVVKQRVIDAAQRIAGYVALSHTWLVSEDEVIFEDTRNKPTSWQHDTRLLSEKKTGFAKLWGFCETARNAPYNARYGWVDTICIDKSSTSELDESIRSMYRWYLNSTVCIVYLAETQASPSLVHMEHDRWFMRGWTLQEYLAPKVVKFHDRNWVPLTDHLRLRHISESQNDKFPHAGLPPEAPRSDTQIQIKVKEATGIPPFLDSHSDDDTDILSASRIIQQMQWAARRETTRQEDRAYGLMGIFRVSFPIAYGEGGERAFFRLVEALLANKPAEQVCALLAWAGRPVGRAIHTTRMLPSAPECYSAPAPRRGPQPTFADSLPNWLATGPTRLPPEPTVLTHIGLRMRLLIVRAVLQDKVGRPGPFDGHLVHFIMRPEALKFKPIDVHLYAEYPTYPKAGDIYPVSACQALPEVAMGTTRSTENPQFLIAIYTFIEDNNYVYIPRSGLGFLLAWYPPANDPWLKDADMASAYLGAWSKVDTRRPVVFERDDNSRNGYTKQSKSELGSRLESTVLATLYL